MSYAFISYQREDMIAVDALCAALELAGVQTWMDRQKLETGRQWKAIVEDRIAGAGAFVLCISKTFEARPDSFMHKELAMAVARLRDMHAEERWLFPVRLDASPLPHRTISKGRSLADYNCADLGTGFDTGARRLASEIAEFLESPDQNMATLVVNNSSRYAGYVAINGEEQGPRGRDSTSFQVRAGDYEICMQDYDWDNDIGGNHNYYSNKVRVSVRPGETAVLLVRDPKKIGFFKKEADTIWIMELVSRHR